MSRADLVPLRIDDPACQGVTSPDGRREYPKDRTGRVWVPPHEARRLKASGHGDLHSGAPRAGMGINPCPEVQAAYEAWGAHRSPADPWVPYATWYRTVYHREEA